LSQLTDKIASPLRDKVQLNCEVRQIRKKLNGYEIDTGNGRFLCKHLVSTIPAYALKRLILDQSFIQVLEKVNYSPVDVFHFGFKKENIKNKDQGFGVLTKPSDLKKYLGILFSSRTFGHVAPAGCELFTVIVGGERQRELCDLPSEELERIILSELEQLINHHGEVVLKNHFRWKKGIPQYEMNHQELIDALAQFEKRNKDFYVLGNFHGGVSVSDCINKSKIMALKLSK
jgi:oxygen-dependent protoporphyrinogen oxidase